MVNGATYQSRYAPPVVRPPQQLRQLGAVADMGILDWAMLGGGAIVASAGVNSVIKGLPSKKHKISLMGLIVGGVVTLVGGTVFVQEFRKLTA